VKQVNSKKQQSLVYYVDAINKKRNKGSLFFFFFYQGQKRQKKDPRFTDRTFFSPASNSPQKECLLVHAYFLLKSFCLEVGGKERELWKEELTFLFIFFFFSFSK